MTTYRDQLEYWQGIGKRRSAGHPVVRAYAEGKLDLVRRALHARIGQQRATMLEVGAGNGFLSAVFDREFDLTVLDFSRNMLERNPVVPWRKVVGAAERLPFRGESFDLVMCANLLHHLEDPLVAVREMARCARLGVVLVEPCARNPLMFLFGAARKAERGSLKFFPWYLRGLARKAGLKVITMQVHGALLPNRTPGLLLAVARRLDRSGPLGFYTVAVLEKR